VRGVEMRGEGGRTEERRVEKRVWKAEGDKIRSERIEVIKSHEFRDIPLQQWVRETFST
jgi:hypothetical protein